MRKSNRQLLLEWAEQSQISADDLPRAMRLGDAVPSQRDWRSFLDMLLLGLGGLLTVCGVVFFFAYNWDNLGRFTRFMLVEALIVFSLGAVWRLGLEKISGRVALLMAAVFVGVLLALVGQTYQTGADTYELFAVWTVLILPWAFLGRFDGLWVLWLLLLNLSIVLYYDTFGRWFNGSFGVEQLLWMLFVINTCALIIWEWVVAKGQSRRSLRWMTRLLATVSGGLITSIAIIAIVDDSWTSFVVGAIGWLVWMACAYVWYRLKVLDVYVLAIGVLSVVAVLNVVIGRMLFHGFIGGVIGLLVISLSVIGCSALGAVWLKRIVNEAQS